MADSRGSANGAHTKINRDIFVANSLRVRWLVFTALVLDLVAFASILPVLPNALAFYEQSASAGSLFHMFAATGKVLSPILPLHHDGSPAVYVGGLLGSLYSLLQLAMSPVIGRASDKYGRRTVAIWCGVGTVVSQIIWFRASTFPLFVVSRIIAGCTRGLVQISTTVMADVTRPAERGRGMALIGIAFSIGFTVGPPLGALVQSQGLILHSILADPTHPFTSVASLAMLLSVGCLTLVVAALPETKAVPERPAKQDIAALDSDLPRASGAQSPCGSIARSFEQRRSSLERSLYKVTVLFLFVFSGFESTLAFLTSDRLGFSAADNGRLLAFVGIVAALVQGALGRRRRNLGWGELELAILGISALALSLVVLAVAHTYAGLYIGAGLYALASAIVVPAFNTAASLLAKEDSMGTVLGKMRSAGQLGRTLGPTIYAAAYWSLGASNAHFMGALSTLIPLALTVRLARVWSSQRLP